MASVSPLAAHPYELRTQWRRPANGKVPAQVLSLPMRKRKPMGLCVHTTGGGIVEQAHRLKRPLLKHCAEFYLDIDNYGPHYVVGYDGSLIQVVDEMRIAMHVGLKAEERELLESGEWRGPVKASALWDAYWKSPGQGIMNPLDICGGRSPNDAYIGIEMPPLEKPDPDGLWFTIDQHDSVAQLAVDIFARHGLLPQRERIVGHEDVQPLSRWDKGGGWDPGGLRPQPRFDWPYVLHQLGL